MSNIKKFVFIYIFTLLFCNDLFAKGNNENNNSTWSKYTEFNNEYIIKNFEETPEAFPNPMKGLRPTVDPFYPTFRNHEYGSVYKQYIKYSDLEMTANDSVQKIINWSNNAWAGIEKRNIKVIPRVVLTFPEAADGDYSPGWHDSQDRYLLNDFWPSDIQQESLTSRWFSKELEARLKNFVRKLGEAWDNDSRVAAIEIGLWGYYGEHHLQNAMGDFNRGLIPQSIQKVLGDAFNEAFKNKKIMMRYPNTFTNYVFGFYDDSFSHPGERENENRIIQKNVWRNQMISGEVAYDWGDLSQYGRKPDETFKNIRFTDYLINRIKRLNASSLGWISDYSQGDLSLKANTARMQKALGYRFVIRSAVYKERADKSENIRFGFEVSNIGNAPFYYAWPVEVSLLDQNRNVVYKKNLNVDIRTWLPGETYIITDSITIPNNLASDTYILAVSILDPAGNLPSLRFANNNYFYGGRTPIGIIGVNTEPKGNFDKFDLLRTDRSLQYTVVNNNPVNRTINKGQGIPYIINSWIPNGGDGSSVNVQTGSENIDGNNFTVYSFSGNHVNRGYAQAFAEGNTTAVNSLRRMRAFSFSVLGDGNDYKVSLPTSETFTNAAGWDNYHIIFPTIKGEVMNIIVYIDTLSQDGYNTVVRFNQNNIKHIQFEPLYYGVGQFNIKIWDIRTYN